MVNVPAEIVLDQTLSVGVIYRFTAPELITTEIPHYFIVMAIEEGDNYMVVCTSQKDNQVAYFDRMELDFNGLVYLKPDNDNGLTKDSYVNCNEYFTVSRQSLIDKIDLAILEYRGGISLNHYDQIRKGIVQSYINDLPDYLLVHPDE